MSRRRLTSDRKALFTKYLALGGVDTDQRQFTGTAKDVKDMKDDEEYDADHVREVTANEVLSREWEEIGKYYNPYYPEHWDVDFAGVVAGFMCVLTLFSTRIIVKGTLLTYGAITQWRLAPQVDGTIGP